MTDAPNPEPDLRPMREADPEREAAREDEYALDPELARGVSEALEAEAPERIKALVADLHPADLADLLEQLDAETRRRLVEALGPDLPPQALTELGEGARDAVLRHLDPEVLAEAVKELDTDDVVYLIEDLPESERQIALDALDPQDRFLVARSLTYPEYSAGRLMQREVVTAPPFWTVGQMIDFMRTARDLPHPFYDVIVVDPAMKPIGMIPLSMLLGARRPQTLESLMQPSFRTLRVTEPQEDVAYAFNKYHLVTAPVVDADERLVGVITIDDAMNALQEEAEEDIRRLAGVGDEEISDSVREIVRRRAPWLAINLCTAIVASRVIAQFEDVIAQIVALAALMPIIASMGGNAGTQTLTVAVRAIATRNLTGTNAFRVIRREVVVGLVNGLLFAAALGGLGYAWFGDLMLALVLGSAMVINLLVAALAGILVPIGLEKAGADPALASGTFVTTMTDVVGFFAFLGLAGAMLL